MCPIKSKKNERRGKHETAGRSAALSQALLPGASRSVPGLSAGQSYGAANDAARRAAEQAAADRARAAASQLELDRQRLQREQAESQRRVQSPSVPNSSTSYPNDGRSSERGPATSAPTSRMSEQEQRDLERARAYDRGRAKQEDDFKTYVKDCQSTNRLSQSECRAASEDIRANAATMDLRNRMGTRRWEDYRFYRKIPPEFAQEIARVEELSTMAGKSRDHWNKGTQPNPPAPTTSSNPSGSSQRPALDSSRPVSEPPRATGSGTQPVQPAAPITPKSKEQIHREASVAFDTGLDFFLKGDPRAAQNHFQKAVDLEPQDPNYRHLLVAAYSQSGELSAARAHCMVLITLAPDRFSYFDPQGEKGDTCLRRRP